MSIDGRIDAHAENVLMVLRKGSWTNHVALGSSLAGVDVDDRDDARCPCLDYDAGRLIEFKGKNVLIVGERDDELDDEFPTTSYDGPFGSPVGVLPIYAVVLFVEANDIFGDLARAVSFRQDTVKILSAGVGSRRQPLGFVFLWTFVWSIYLDDPQAVVPEGEIVHCVPGPTVAKVECLLAMERLPRIRVWYRLSKQEASSATIAS